MTLPEANKIQIYYNYDKAVVDFLHNNLFWPATEEAKKIPCVFATPERALSEIWKRTNPNGNPVKDTQKKFMLPFISIDRTGWQFDPKRSNKLRIRDVATNADGKSYTGMDWPIPVILKYDIQFWTRNLFDMDYIINSLYLLFDVGMRATITVTHPEPFGDKYSSIFITNDTRLDPIVGESEQRIMKRNIGFDMYGFIFRNTTLFNTGIVETVHTKVDDLETEEIYDNIVVDENGIV